MPIDSTAMPAAASLHGSTPMMCDAEPDHPVALHLKADEGYWVATVVGDRFYGIFPYIFTVAIQTGRIDDLTGYEQRWCYETLSEAMNALVRWTIADFKGEPEGWHRHIPSNRRRPDGEVEKEYVKD